MALLFAMCVQACGHASSPVGLGTVSSALYARADTNDITVWSPRTRIAGTVGDATNIEAAYTMDSWTGASIDVTTAATRAIHEIRHELTAGAGTELQDLSIGGSYRYSTENDYWSHGGVGTAALDLAQNNTRLALAVFGSRDTVGKASDPAFRLPQRSVGARFTLTQVVDTKTLVQLGWETAQVLGYQASPYRYVAVGDRGTCASPAPDCIPERVPDERFRHALVGRARRALAARLSAGVEYRFYFDSWGLASQTLSPDLRLLVGQHGTFSLDYRYYTQREAGFYRPRYAHFDASGGYFTRDRELSAFYAHRLGSSYLHAFEFRNGDLLLTAALRAGATRYRYLAFVGLSQVHALEATCLLSLDFH